MAVTEVRDLTIHFVSYFAAFTPARNHRSPLQSVLDLIIEHTKRHHQIAKCVSPGNSKRPGSRKQIESFARSGNSVRQGRAEVLASYKKSYQAEGREMGVLNFSELQVDSLGKKSALARGRWLLTMKDGRTPGGLFTLILKKSPEGWKIIHDHSSGE